MLHECQTLWLARFRVVVHFYIFYTSTSETYNMWQPERGGWPSPYNGTVEVCQLCTLVVHLLSVSVMYNTKKTFSTFSRDLNRSMTFFQHCTWNTQWAKKIWDVGMFHRPFSIHWYAMLSAMGKLVWVFVSNLLAVCLISTKQAVYYLKWLCKSYVQQVGVCLLRTASSRFYNFLKIAFI